MEARDVATAILIAVKQQQRVVTAARQMETPERRAVRDILTRAGKQEALNFWEGACELADGGT